MPVTDIAPDGVGAGPPAIAPSAQLPLPHSLLPSPPIHHPSRYEDHARRLDMRSSLSATREA
ncbi:hypothetical protein K523DRAFT_359099 [Schizophyllum commune Tattone D]|nr:hypothetical protein K523DRAFT_359099 [Schizophyllum commune Tattone D]